MKKLFCVLFAFLFLSGCASFGRGFAEGILASKEDHKPARQCKVWTDGFQGLKNIIESKNLRVLMVHGVGTHQMGYSTEFMKSLATGLGMNEQKIENKIIHLKSPINGNDLGVIRITQYIDSKTGKTFTFYELTWSSITEPEKQALLNDSNGLYAAKRASLNKTFKNYLNDLSPDALIYLGPKGEDLLSSMRAAVCWMISYNFNELKANTTGVCHINRDNIHQVIKNDELLFITHSLGSRIMLDAFQDLDKLEQTNNSVEVNTIEELKSMFQNQNFTFFMLSNQLPLLQMGRPLPTITNKTKEYCTPTGKHYKERVFNNLDIVAISDPNDLLSYAVEPTFAEHYIDSTLCPTISNVSVNTTDPIDLLGFGELANPIEAHKGYTSSPEVLDLLLNGINPKHVEEKSCTVIKTVP